MPTKEALEEAQDEREAEIAKLKAQLEESQKVIDTLNKKLVKVVKLYNLMVDMYVQGE